MKKATAFTPRATGGFTLVELAIVMTIIGLLIGGVLKGQELLQNSRIAAVGAELKAYASASLTFRDIYKSFPGDIITPANFIQNCTTSPCNISGNGDGFVGPDYPSAGAWMADENNTYWLHLAKAGLINGSTSCTWTTNYFSGCAINNKMGGKITIWSRRVTPDDGLNGRLYYWYMPSTDGTYPNYVIPTNVFMKFDLKFDDGFPNRGIAFLDSSGCGISTAYDPNSASLCTYDVKGEF